MRFWTALKTVPDGIMSTADCCRQTVSMSKSIRTGTRNIVSGTRAYTQTLATMRRHIRTFRYRDWSSRSMLTQRVGSADAGWVLLRTKSRRWKPRCTAIRFPTSAVHRGDICIGANALPKYKTPHALASLPTFLLSIPNGDHSFNALNNKLGMQYRDLLEHLKDKDPSYYYSDVLIPNGKTLKDFIGG